MTLILEQTTLESHRPGATVVPIIISSDKTVTDLQGPPSEHTPEEKLWDFKTRAQQYARDRESCDDVRISYLEFLETEAEDDLALARMIAVLRSVNRSVRLGRWGFVLNVRWRKLARAGL
jgi:hypothetical protein